MILALIWGLAGGHGCGCDCSPVWCMLHCICLQASMDPWLVRHRLCLMALRRTAMHRRRIVSPRWVGLEMEVWECVRGRAYRHGIPVCLLAVYCMSIPTQVIILGRGLSRAVPEGWWDGETLSRLQVARPQETIIPTHHTTCPRCAGGTLQLGWGLATLPQTPLMVSSAVRY